MESFTLKATAKAGADKGRGCMPLAPVRAPIHVAAKSPMRPRAGAPADLGPIERVARFTAKWNGFVVNTGRRFEAPSPLPSHNQRLLFTVEMA